MSVRVDAFGTNCGKGPREVAEAVEELVADGPVDEQLPLVAFPNAGYPEVVNGRFLYLTTPEYMADAARRMVATISAVSTVWLGRVNTPYPVNGAIAALPNAAPTSGAYR